MNKESQDRERFVALAAVWPTAIEFDSAFSRGMVDITDRSDFRGHRPRYSDPGGRVAGGFVLESPGIFSGPNVRRIGFDYGPFFAQLQDCWAKSGNSGQRLSGTVRLCLRTALLKSDMASLQSKDLEVVFDNGKHHLPGVNLSCFGRFGG